MSNISELLQSPFREMYENFVVAKGEIPDFFNSKHWEVFPENYEKTILSTGSWKNFLRNSISIGFNDELLALGNKRWLNSENGNEIDVWEMRRKHDHRVLKEVIESQDDLIESLNQTCAVCSVIFVLENLASNTGAPLVANISLGWDESSLNEVTKKMETKRRERTIDCNSFDLGTIYYFWQISRLMDEITHIKNPLVADIGPGYGLLMAKMKKKYPSCRCILFDLPAMSAVQSYYLSTEFPDAKILYYADILESGNSIFETDFDFLILPGWMIEKIPDPTSRCLYQHEIYDGNEPRHY